MKHKKLRGHYCWVCDRMLANERFSGGGHSRHICKDCSKLGSEELSYRQDVRNIDRCIGFDGGIRRKQRKTFDRFLTHENPRVREYTLKIKEDMERRRNTWNENEDEDDSYCDFEIAFMDDLYR
jgi:hypothetical protein